LLTEDKTESVGCIYILAAGLRDRYVL